MKRINIRRAVLLQLSFVLLFAAVAPAAHVSAAQRAARKANRTTVRPATRAANRTPNRTADKLARAAAGKTARTTADRARATTEKTRATAQTLLAAGSDHHQSGRYKDAIASFNNAITLVPALPSAHYNLGLAHEKSGQYIEALKAFDSAVRLDPNNADAHARRGAMRNYFGLHKEAVLSLRQAIRLRPNVAADHNILASALYRLGQYNEAATTLENSLRIFPDVATYENLSGAYQKLGRTADAATAQRRAARLKLQRADAARTASQVAAETERSTAQRTAPQTQTTADPRPAASTPKPVARIEERANTRADRSPVVEPRREDVARRGNVNVTTTAAPRSSAATNGTPRRTRNTPPPTNTASNAETPRITARANSSLAAETTIPAANSPASVPTSAPTIATPDQPTPRAREVVTAVNTPKAESVTVAPDKAAPTAPAPINLEPTATQPASTEPAKSATAAAAAAVAAEPLLTNTYRVGIGDVLDVRLLNAPAAGSTLYTVLAGGLLDYPLAGGAIPVAGLEPKEIAAQLAARVKVYDAPEVVVSVREYASHTVAVNGLVANPGVKVLRSEAVPLYVLLADAQPRTEAGRAVIISPASGESRTVALDNAEAINTLVRPNDVITVQAPAAQFYYISGEVNDPGEKALRPNTTLTQAVLAAGIFSRLPSEVQISRKAVDGATVITRYNLKQIRAGKTPDPALQAGDWVEVVN